MGLAVKMKDPATGLEYSFNPSRDIAYMYPQLVQLAGKGLVPGYREAWYADLLKDATEEQLFNTVQSFMKFCSSATQRKYNDNDGVYNALKDSGFFDCPSMTQLVFLAKVGQICAGAFWHGIRSAAKQDEIPIGLQELADRAAELGRYLDEKRGKNAEGTDSASPTCPSMCAGAPSTY